MTPAERECERFRVARLGWADPDRVALAAAFAYVDRAPAPPPRATKHGTAIRRRGGVTR